MESPFQWLQNAAPGKAGSLVPSPELSSVAPHTPVLSRAAVVAVVGDNAMNILGCDTLGTSQPEPHAGTSGTASTLSRTAVLSQIRRIWL